MDPWIEEWRDRAFRVIGEEEGNPLPMYEEIYSAALRVFASLLDHGEESSEGADQSSCEEIVLLRARYEEVVRAHRSSAEHEEALHLRFSTLGDLERLLWELDEVVREVVIAEHDSLRDELDGARVELEGVQRTLWVECDAFRDKLKRTRIEPKGYAQYQLPRLLFPNQTRLPLEVHEAQEDMKSALHRSAVLRGMLIEAGNDPSLTGVAKTKGGHIYPHPHTDLSLLHPPIAWRAPDRCARG
ncbi:hypothetical protein AMTR_s00070p00090640 [Amborella trichopoda]|uniref:Uncharacterized protein n=1 Tax=Amborella trichopoda TaxID=13333 RepID=U5D4T2_AMBTC|nr:hypothetical protein AMTR_s00070p00090640 [Amborella trichopoda]